MENSRDDSAKGWKYHTVKYIYNGLIGAGLIALLYPIFRPVRYTIGTEEKPQILPKIIEPYDVNKDGIINGKEAKTLDSELIQPLLKSKPN